MRVLVACEESQTVCKAFRARGHEAYSCDLQECSGGHPEWHVMGDAVKMLRGGVFVTMDGQSHFVDKWDLLIAHPPCTYLSNVATRSFSLKNTPAEKVVKRWENRAKATVLFMQFALAPVERVCVENPCGFMTSAWRSPDQYIDPWLFADSVDSEDYTKKRTGLWLKNLPKLRATTACKEPNLRELYGVYANGKARTWEETLNSKDRGKERSKTFPSIAKAMAEQWG